MSLYTGAYNIIFIFYKRLRMPFKGAIYLHRPCVRQLTTDKVRIGMDVDNATAEWIRKLKSEYTCRSNRELFLLALASLEDKGLPPEVHLIASEKGEPIEEDPLALMWRNICAQQRRIDNLQVHKRSDLETLTRMIGEQRRQLKIYADSSLTEYKDFVKLVDLKIQELKDERAQLEALKRRRKEADYVTFLEVP